MAAVVRLLLVVVVRSGNSMRWNDMLVITDARQRMERQERDEHTDRQP
ncbi:hypothetical protein [Prauserella muralis]|nr:hypothetical protein [Prauserella muralis]